MPFVWGSVLLVLGLTAFGHIRAQDELRWDDSGLRNRFGEHLPIPDGLTVDQRKIDEMKTWLDNNNLPINHRFGLMRRLQDDNPLIRDGRLNRDFDFVPPWDNADRLFSNRRDFGPLKQNAYENRLLDNLRRLDFLKQREGDDRVADQRVIMRDYSPLQDYQLFRDSEAVRQHNEANQRYGDPFLKEGVKLFGDPREFELLSNFDNEDTQFRNRIQRDIDPMGHRYDVGRLFTNRRGFENMDKLSNEERLLDNKRYFDVIRHREAENRPFDERREIEQMRHDAIPFRGQRVYRDVDSMKFPNDDSKFRHSEGDDSEFRDHKDDHHFQIDDDRRPGDNRGFDLLIRLVDGPFRDRDFYNYNNSHGNPEDDVPFRHYRVYRDIDGFRYPDYENLRYDPYGDGDSRSGYEGDYRYLGDGDDSLFGDRRVNNYFDEDYDPLLEDRRDYPYNYDYEGKLLNYRYDLDGVRYLDIEDEPSEDYKINGEPMLQRGCDDLTDYFDPAENTRVRDDRVYPYYDRNDGRLFDDNYDYDFMRNRDGYDESYPNNRYKRNIDQMRTLFGDEGTLDVNRALEQMAQRNIERQMNNRFDINSMRHNNDAERLLDERQNFDFMRNDNAPLLQHRIDHDIQSMLKRNEEDRIFNLDNQYGEEYKPLRENIDFLNVNKYPHEEVDSMHHPDYENVIFNNRRLEHNNPDRLFDIRRRFNPIMRDNNIDQVLDHDFEMRSSHPLFNSHRVIRDVETIEYPARENILLDNHRAFEPMIHHDYDNALLEDPIAFDLRRNDGEPNRQIHHQKNEDLMRHSGADESLLLDQNIDRIAQSKRYTDVNDIVDRPEDEMIRERNIPELVLNDQRDIDPIIGQKEIGSLFDSLRKFEPIIRNGPLINHRDYRDIESMKHPVEMEFPINDDREYDIMRNFDDFNKPIGDETLFDPTFHPVYEGRLFDEQQDLDLIGHHDRPFSDRRVYRDISSIERLNEEKSLFDPSFEQWRHPELSFERYLASLRHTFRDQNLNKNFGPMKYPDNRDIRRDRNNPGLLLDNLREFEPMIRREDIDSFVDPRRNFEPLVRGPYLTNHRVFRDIESMEQHMEVELPLNENREFDLIRQLDDSDHPIEAQRLFESSLGPDYEDRSFGIQRELDLSRYHDQPFSGHRVYRDLASIERLKEEKRIFNPLFEQSRHPDLFLNTLRSQNNVNNMFHEHRAFGPIPTRHGVEPFQEHADYRQLNGLEHLNYNDRQFNNRRDFDHLKYIENGKISQQNQELYNLMRNHNEQRAQFEEQKQRRDFEYQRNRDIAMQKNYELEMQKNLELEMQKINDLKYRQSSDFDLQKEQEYDMQRQRYLHSRRDRYLELKRLQGDDLIPTQLRTLNELTYDDLDDFGMFPGRFHFRCQFEMFSNCSNWCMKLEISHFELLLNNTIGYDSCNGDKKPCTEEQEAKIVRCVTGDPPEECQKEVDDYLHGTYNCENL